MDSLSRAGQAAPSLPQMPEPVARYLRRALKGQSQTLQAVTLRQSGTLRTSVESARWMAFRATHAVRPARTEFVWEANVRILPLVDVQVRDSYTAGEGAGRVKLMSALTVAHHQGGEAMNSGSLHRFLAEAVWYPTALLPSAALHWSPISDSKALATLTHAGTTVSLEFWFHPNGEVAGIYTPGRWGLFAEGFKQVPWEGHFADYRLLGGLLVPVSGEVGWHVNGKWRCVWKGQIDHAHYEFAP